eukprot:Tamp_10158.p1 GENE.Tamp_10158~~Tamp_10158.p1  ORF type:complete len:539 (+),score=77.56 Tamp_10158:87-1619(+)
MGGGGPSSQPQAATSGDPDESLDQYAQSRWIAGASPIVAAPGLQPSALGAAAAAGVGARSRLAAGARALGTVASSIASATGLMDSSSDEYSDDDTGSYSQDSLSRAPIGDAGGSMPRNLQQRLETASAASPAAAAGASASASPPLVFAQTFSDIEIAAPDAPAAQGATRPLALRHDNIAVAAQPSASATPHQPTADQPPARPPYQDAPASSLFRLPEAGLDASPSSPDPLSDWDSQEGRPWSQTLSPIRRETQSVSATPRGLLQKPLLKPAMPEPRSAPRSTSIDAELLFMDIVADDVQAPMRPRAPPTPLERVLSPRGAPTARAALTLTLAMQLEDIDDMPLFKREVASDVAVALGPRATDVVVTRLRAGSVVVDLDATPLGGLSPAQVRLRPCFFPYEPRRRSCRRVSARRIRKRGAREREGRARVAACPPCFVGASAGVLSVHPSYPSETRVSTTCSGAAAGGGAAGAGQRRMEPAHARQAHGKDRPSGQHSVGARRRSYRPRFSLE